MRVDDPAALPLDNSATADPNDEVIGVDFSGGLASVVTQLNALFGAKLQFSNPSGTTLQVLDDGAANTTDVDALSVTQTATALAGGRARDCRSSPTAATPFTGAIIGVGIAEPSDLPAASPSTRRCSAIRPSSSLYRRRHRRPAIRPGRTSSTTS